MNLKPNLRAIWASLLFLLVVVSITFVAIPRYLQMSEKIKEANNNPKFNLGTIKSAASIYYGDSQGIWPRNLEKDLVPKYLKAIPALHLEKYGHKSSNQVEYYPFLNSVGILDDPYKLRDTGHWLYDSKTGTILIDCTHVSGGSVFF
jgi:hypothetical protein